MIRVVAQALGATVLLSFLLVCQTSAQNCAPPDTNVLTTSGSGRVFVETNIARIVLGVQVDAANASQAQAQAAEIAQNIVSALQGLNVSNLQTSSISLTQITPPTPTPFPLPATSTTSGGSAGQQQQQPEEIFRASNQVQFEIPADRAGEALDTAVAAGANTILSVSLIATDEDVASAQEEATRLAIANALNFGRLLLSSIGCNASGVGTITLSPLFAPPSVPGVADAASISAASTPVLRGQTEVTSNVQVSIIHNCPASAVATLNTSA